jgi:hypothetical protein
MGKPASAKADNRQMWPKIAKDPETGAQSRKKQTGSGGWVKFVSLAPVLLMPSISWRGLSPPACLLRHRPSQPACTKQLGSAIDQGYHLPLQTWWPCTNIAWRCVSSSFVCEKSEEPSERSFVRSAFGVLRDHRSRNRDLIRRKPRSLLSGSEFRHSLACTESSVAFPP